MQYIEEIGGRTERDMTQDPGPWIQAQTQIIDPICVWRNTSFFSFLK